ncbi:hypothetical protein FQB35_12405 [Crassaminicella thermophila]|uniref:Uncharacterized protein n=1 Tax=Crassaminicella thermophila TaxID=2599308 RepID=A0A5C0SI04_CRATE|nr:hypothetical protein [Crassaminicella thermophila]QEK13054.1 hypothetical protein FQB35_12405 [Crassaminicella thermophila]
MKDSTQMINFIIQKKFKEVLDAKKQGRLYDFRNELKKELEVALEELHNTKEKEKMEHFLEKVKKLKVKKGYIN